MFRLFRSFAMQSNAINTIAIRPIIKEVNTNYLDRLSQQVSHQRPKPARLFFKPLVEKALTQDTLSDANKAWVDAIEYGVPPRSP